MNRFPTVTSPISLNLNSISKYIPILFVRSSEECLSEIEMLLTQLSPAIKTHTGQGNQITKPKGTKCPPKNVWGMFYGIDLSTSIERLHQSEHSISTDLDQWEWFSLMQKQRSWFNSQTKQNQLKLVQRWCWPSQAGGQRPEHLNQYKRLKWRLKIRMMKNILFSVGTLK